MSKTSGMRSLTAILSLLTLGAALSFGLGKAVAADDVTEDQIVRALAPKKPLTSGGDCRGRPFCSDHPGPRHALALEQ